MHFVRECTERKLTTIHPRQDYLGEEKKKGTPLVNNMNVILFWDACQVSQIWDFRVDYAGVSIESFFSRIDVHMVNYVFMQS